MNLTEKDCETFRFLLEVEEIIKTLYFENDPKENLQSLADAIEIERDFLAELKINPYKFLEIAPLIRTAIGELPNKNLLVGTSSILNEINYPYFRLYVRLAKIVLDQTKKRVNSIYMDKEVELLYKILIEEAAKRENVASELKQTAYNILLDSPSTELELVANKLEPFNSVTMAFTSLKKFKATYKTILLRLLYLAKFAKNISDLQNSSEFIISTSYLKTIISSIDPELKQEALEIILKDSFFDRSDFVEGSAIVKKLVINLFENVDKIDYVKHLELVVDNRVIDRLM